MQIPPKQRAALERSLLACAALGLGICSLWSIAEQDIFWQLRAGDELLSSGAFPTQDTWSVSVHGEPWRNLQWLGTLIFSGVHTLGGIPALVLLRGLLVSILMGTIALGTWRRGTTVALACMLLTYAAMLPRLQLRPELLVILVVALLLSPWRNALVHDAWVPPVCVAIAGNLHPGVAPFAVLAAWQVPVVRWRGACAAGCVLAFFATPYGWHALPYLQAHLLYGHSTGLTNPEHQHLNLAYLQSLPGVALGILGCLALAGHYVTHDVPRRERVLSLGTLLLLAALCVERSRAGAFLALFALPWAARALAAPWPWQGMQRVAMACGAAAAALVLGLHLHGRGARWGLDVDPEVFAVRSAAFIAATHPEPNLFNTFADGAYVVGVLRDYPLYVDTRETLFWRLEPELRGAFGPPENMARLTERYGMNTALLPLPPGHNDALGRYFPSSNWALVFFDHSHAVMVRRIPTHAAIIAAFEYTLARPGIPPELYAARAERTLATDQRFRTELRRCLEDDAANAWCLRAQASMTPSAPDPQLAGP